jgi:hypothetical protein
MSRHNRFLNAPYSGNLRKAQGITVYCSDEQGNVRVFIEKEKSIRQALTEICNEIDTWPEEWLIDVISSPTTIWRDLQGHRRKTPTPRVQHFGEDSVPHTWVPEISFLGQIGRIDLLRPRSLA